MLSGPQILTLSMTNGSDQQSEGDTYEHLQLFVEKKCRCGVMVFVEIPTTPTTRPAQPRTKFCKNKKMIICKEFVWKNKYRKFIQNVQLQRMLSRFAKQLSRKTIKKLFKTTICKAGKKIIWKSQLTKRLSRFVKNCPILQSVKKNCLERVNKKVVHFQKSCLECRFAKTSLKGRFENKDNNDPQRFLKKIDQE